jgi:YD repeat-containing protein
MKHIFLILSIFVFNLSYSQVDNFDLLTKNIKETNIKFITKYRESKKFPNGEKKIKLEFNKQGQLLSIEEFEFPMGPDNPIIMRQEIKYDKTGKKIATHIIAPDGSMAVDTLIYNDKGDLIQKQRIANGKLVRTWDYTNKQKVEDKKEFDNKGNLIKLTKSEGNCTIYEYDTTGNLTQEVQFQDGKEYTKNTYQYDKNGRLIKLNIYLLYIGDGTNEPLTYYFEYEVFE